MTLKMLEHNGLDYEIEFIPGGYNKAGDIMADAHEVHTPNGSILNREAGIALGLPIKEWERLETNSDDFQEEVKEFYNPEGFDEGLAMDNYYEAKYGAAND